MCRRLPAPHPLAVFLLWILGLRFQLFLAVKNANLLSGCLLLSYEFTSIVYIVYKQ